ncbi:MAG: group II intron reverse transcriptase/maturase [Nitrospiraceae bacterium]
MTTGKEAKPDIVSGSSRRPQTRPDGEVRTRWAWTEPSVWTRRMLTALENGVRAGTWHSLIDKLYNRHNLRAAYKRVAANAGAAGVDHVTTDAFAHRLEENLEHLHRTLKEGTYRPQAIRRVYIPKPGSKEKRPLGIPTVRDRVVQTALKNVLEPIFERNFAEQSYGFRPGRNCKDALRRVDALLKGGYSYIVDADLKSYFDTIPHEKLLALIRSKVSDGRVLSLIALFLRQGVVDDLAAHVPEAGSPQGAVVSPLLSNIYLDGLDHLMVEHGFEMVRYADDFVVLCRSHDEAQQALALVECWVEEAELRLHPKKTGIVTHEAGFDFLGYHFEPGHRWPSKKSLGKLKDTIRGKTKRTNGQSLDCIIADVNVVLRGWYAYYKHSHRRTFRIIDGWVRMRLRSILRRRSGGTGPGRGFDHQRWPNAYFASCGLFSLRTAYELDRQSSLR